LVSIQEYLETAYRPDRDYLEGELLERNFGELEHSLLQTAVATWFWTRREEWKVLPLVEQRLQVAQARFRVPDIVILRSEQPREAVITIPPLLIIEVLSKDDSLRSMRERVDDYLRFGVKHVWILDPATKRAYVCTPTSFQEPEVGVLAVAESKVRIVLSEIFSQLNT